MSEILTVPIPTRALRDLKAAPANVGIEVIKPIEWVPRVVEVAELVTPIDPEGN